MSSFTISVKLLSVSYPGSKSSSNHPPLMKPRPKICILIIFIMFFMSMKNHHCLKTYCSFTMFNLEIRGKIFPFEANKEDLSQTTSHSSVVMCYFIEGLVPQCLKCVQYERRIKNPKLILTNN